MYVMLRYVTSCSTVIADTIGGLPGIHSYISYLHSEMDSRL